MRGHNQTIFFLERLQPDQLPKKPGAAYQWSTRLLGGLVIGLLGGLLVGLLVGLLFVGLLVGLGFGLIFGRLGAQLVELGANGQHYILRFWLARTHTFPWKAVPFLEAATARILLRRVGGGYSFTHRLLLDYFADLDAQGSPISTAVHPSPSPAP